MTACPSGKVAYRNGAEAWRARRGFCHRKGESRALEAYRCQLCEAWHLGRNPKRIPRWKRG